MRVKEHGGFRAGDLVKLLPGVLDIYLGTHCRLLYYEEDDGYWRANFTNKGNAPGISGVKNVSPLRIRLLERR